MSWRNSTIITISIVFLGGPFGDAASADDHTFELPASEILLEDCPIQIAVPESLGEVEHLEVVDLRTKSVTDAQRIGDSERCVFILQDPISAGETPKFSIQKSKNPPADKVTVSRDEGRVIMSLNDKNVLAYNVEVVSPPEGADPIFRRSGHIHPAWTPDGLIVTDEFPADHVHQHAIFSAWTKTTFEGERVDFWNQKAETGTVEHREVLDLVSGPVFGELKVRLAHVVTKTENQDVLDEVWTIRLFAIADPHFFEIESVQTCVAETPLTIDEYHYGGFAFRGAAEFFSEQGHSMVTNETSDRVEGNHSRPDWVSLFGQVSGKQCGAVMFSHPENFRSPQPVRLHPTKPYFVFSPCVLGEFSLEPGQPFRSRYAYLTFDGTPDRKRIGQLWTTFGREDALTIVP
ncbi:hypothetical protein KOR42_31470 [Thalassoglobus neptunius]|uniref:Methane oxygenase PmoA n=1 Tax=Thalassoglobus neptunius TaxID=1938619 RepID=A0A5C5WN60_9PLAN|nr:PmoA family protein [Thalassoglobus neptunius]TWT52050.1 hypothetical protein KOR42_31470 [Thalassoglobus neptunius]